MKRSHLTRSCLLAIALLTMANSATAANCGYSGEPRPATGIMPLQIGSITVGRDVPLGSVVYSQRYKAALPITLECTNGPFSTQISYSFTIRPKALSQWSNGPFAGKVFLTDVAGLGVVYNTTQGVAPRSNAVTPFCVGKDRCTVKFDNASDFEVLLIKIGDVGPGIVQGTSFPTIQAAISVGDSAILSFRASVSGTINIVARTCTTPPVVVAMGTRMLSEFKGVNSATAWKDFVIALNDCPAYMGTYAVSGPSWNANGGNNGGTATAGTRTENTFMIRIDSVRAPIDALRGILSIDPSAAGLTPAASGVGVQIGTRSGASLPLATIHTAGFTLLSVGSSYVIALSARYLQTSNKLTPGPANASATFTIIYQ